MNSRRRDVLDVTLAVLALAGWALTLLAGIGLVAWWVAVPFGLLAAVALGRMAAPP